MISCTHCERRSHLGFSGIPKTLLTRLSLSRSPNYQNKLIAAVPSLGLGDAQADRVVEVFRQFLIMPSRHGPAAAGLERDRISY